MSLYAKQIYFFFAYGIWGKEKEILNESKFFFEKREGESNIGKKLVLANEVWRVNFFFFAKNRPKRTFFSILREFRYILSDC